MVERVLSQQIRTMAACIAKGQAVFFVGAGMSAMAGAPTWDELITPLKRGLGMDQDDDTPPALIAQFYRNHFGDNQLYMYLRSQLALPTLKPTPAHETLASMPVSVFVTTNYDDLLESALRRNGRRFHIIRDEAELPLWNEPEETQVLKMHGDLTSATSIVLTDWDYVRFVTEKSLFKRKLAELFCYRDVIFVGYSLRDPNVSLIFNAIAYELGNLRRQSHIVTFDAGVHQQEEWQRRGMQPVCLGPSETSDGSIDDRSERLTHFLSDLMREVNATNRSILIVDDDTQLLGAWKRMIESHVEGARVHTACDGVAAALLFGKLRPRLIIVDLAMPKLDGWGFVTLVRGFANANDTKIIVASGDANRWSPVRAATLEVEHFLDKGSGTRALLTLVKHALGIRPGYSGIPPRSDPDEDEGATSRKLVV